MRPFIALVSVSSCIVSVAATSGRLRYRDEIVHLKRQTSAPANNPCTTACSPFFTAATPCNGAASCLCTTAIYQDIQTCVTCLGNAGGSTVSTDIESAAAQFNQKCAGAVPSVTIPISAAANTGIPDSGAGGFSAGGGGFGASSDGTDFNTFSDGSFNTDGGSGASPTFAASGFGTPATAGITIAGGAAAAPATNANPFAPAAATANAGTGSSGSGAGSGGLSGSSGSSSGSGSSLGSIQVGGATKGKSGAYTARTPSIQHFENGVAAVVTMALLLNL